MEYMIFTDTSANLPESVTRDGQVGVLPFGLCCDGKESLCPVSGFDGTEFYNAVRKGMKVRTAQVNEAAYIDAFEPVLQAGRDVLFIGMSSGISGSYRSAERAAETLREAYPGRRIETVDTLAASLGEGLMVIQALRLQKEGKTLDEVLAQVRGIVPRMCQVFMVDDLFNLKRGGRLSGTAALLGTALGIKPLLRGNENGQIVSFGKARGRAAAIEALAARYEALAESPETQTIGIAHADCEADAVRLASLLQKSRPAREIVTVMYEPCTGSHVGPGALALFFLGGPSVRLVK